MNVRLSVKLNIGFVGATHQDVIDVDVPDDATGVHLDDLLRIAATEWADNFIDLSYTPLNSNDL